jgi:hypothetical protein
MLQRDREQQVAALGALPLVLQQAVGPGEPTTGLRQLPLVDQVERQPERAPRGPPRIAALGMQLLRALQRPQAILDTAEEIRRGRQQLQILRCQGGRPVGQRQRGVGVRPRQPSGSLAAPRKLTIPAHRAPLQPVPAPHLGSVARPRGRSEWSEGDPLWSQLAKDRRMGRRTAFPQAVLRPHPPPSRRSPDQARTDRLDRNAARKPCAIPRPPPGGLATHLHPRSPAPSRQR